MTPPVRGDKLRWRAMRGYRICGSQLEIQHARQRDELGVAVWKRGQPEKCDDQAHPEKFLLHMYIGATVHETFVYLLPLFIYSIPIASTCWECDCVDEVACSTCMNHISIDVSMYILRLKYMYVLPLFVRSTQLCLPAGSVFAWTKSRARYIHIALFTYITPLADRECACVDKVAI